MLPVKSRVEDGITNLSLYTQYSADEVPGLLRPFLLTYGGQASNKVKSIIRRVGNVSKLTKTLESICEDGFVSMESMDSAHINYHKIRPLFPFYKANFRGGLLPKPVVDLHDGGGKSKEYFNREYYNILVKGSYGDLMVGNYAKPTQKFSLHKLFKEAESPINNKDNSLLSREMEREVCNKFLTVSHKIRELEDEFGLSSASMKKVAALLDSNGYVYFSTGKKKLPKSVMTDTILRISELERVANHFATLMLIHNERLVMKFAKEYTSRAKSLTFNDMLQEGRMGMLRALKRFDPGFGTKFSTYSSWWVQQAMLRALIGKDRIVEIPVYLNELAGKVHKFSKQFVAKEGRLPSGNEISESLHVSVDSVNRVLSSAPLSRVKSLSDSTVESDEGSELTLDTLISADDSNEDGFIAEVDRNLLKDNVAKLLSSLPEREERVIRKRFGIGYAREYTLEEIGNEFDLSRERIRRVEAKALGKLKKIKKEDYI